MTENRILFTGGRVFDGTGAPAAPADVVVRGDRIESVRPGGGTEIEAGDQVIDCAGAATWYGGQLMDRPVGLLTPGYLADVLVVRGEPDQDVTVLQHRDNLLAIMQDGAFRKLSGQLAA